MGFALLWSVIGLENLCHPLDQSDAKLKPIAVWSLVFSFIEAVYTCLSKLVLIGSL